MCHYPTLKTIIAAKAIFFLSSTSLCTSRPPIYEHFLSSLGSISNKPLSNSSYSVNMSTDLFETFSSHHVELFTTQPSSIPLYRPSSLQFHVTVQKESPLPLDRQVSFTFWTIFFIIVRTYGPIFKSTNFTCRHPPSKLSSGVHLIHNSSQLLVPHHLPIVSAPLNCAHFVFIHNNFPQFGDNMPQ